MNKKNSIYTAIAGLFIGFGIFHFFSRFISTTGKSGPFLPHPIVPTTFTPQHILISGCLILLGLGLFSLLKLHHAKGQKGNLQQGGLSPQLQVSRRVIAGTEGPRDVSILINQIHPNLRQIREDVQKAMDKEGKLSPGHQQSILALTGQNLNDLCDLMELIRRHEEKEEPSSGYPSRP